jgi:hypothetical protein
LASDDYKLPMGRSGGQGLVDILDRILDKGLVVAGDVKVSLADVELLTIRIRLLICSVDKAEKIGLDWWRSDPYFSSAARMLAAQTAAGQLPAPADNGAATKALEAKISALDAKLDALLKQGSAVAADAEVKKLN